jgi:hypothetical protein
MAEEADSSTPAGVKVKGKIKISGRMDLYELPADFTYEDFRSLSEEERRQFLKESGHNLEVNGGLDQICNLIVGANSNAFTKCGVGSSSIVVTASQTALGAQIGSTLTVTSAYIESIGKAHFDSFFGNADNNGTWVESGIFTTGGLMLCRRTFAAFVKSSSNTAVAAWTIFLVAT